jgi:hypothetical protein
LKRFALLCISIIFAFTLFGCSIVSKNSNDNEKFTMNASVAIGALDKDNLDKTKITYEVVISGDKEDINSIYAQEPIINTQYIDMMLENGPHKSQVKGIENPYLELTGRFVFDTAGKSKEEIDGMCLFQGIKIIDKDNNEYTLKFNKN